MPVQRLKRLQKEEASEKPQDSAVSPTVYAPLRSIFLAALMRTCIRYCFGDMLSEAKKMR